MKRYQRIYGVHVVDKMVQQADQDADGKITLQGT